MIPDRTKQLESLNGNSMADVEKFVLDIAQAEIDSMGLENSVKLLGARVYGSRSREGLYTAKSDLDVVLSYSGNIKEDVFFNILNGYGISISGIPLDINPISVERSGTLEDYMQVAERYLDEKESQMKPEKRGRQLSYSPQQKHKLPKTPLRL